MILGRRFSKKITVSDGERILFDAPGSEVRGRSFVSLVGGHVYVTSQHVAFTPNSLAALLGRQPWVRRIRELAAELDSTVLGFPLGETAVLRLEPKAGTAEPFEPMTLFLASNRLHQLHDAIEKARYWA